VNIVELPDVEHFGKSRFRIGDLFSRSIAGSRAMTCAASQDETTRNIGGQVFGTESVGWVRPGVAGGQLAVDVMLAADFREVAVLQRRA
jgi:hypothetical protein